MRIELAERAARRAARKHLLSLGRGLHFLGTATVVIPWLGVLLTCWFIVMSFKGCPCGSRLQAYARICNDLATAVVPMAMSLPVATLTYAARLSFVETVNSMSAEMEATALDLQRLLTSSRRA